MPARVIAVMPPLRTRIPRRRGWGGAHKHHMRPDHHKSQTRPYYLAHGY